MGVLEIDTGSAYREGGLGGIGGGDVGFTLRPSGALAIWSLKT